MREDCQGEGVGQIARSAARYRGSFVLASVFLGSLLTGCQTGSFSLPSLPKPPVDDVSVSRLERKKELLANYDQRRNTALYQSAKSRWEHGDWVGCKNDLTQLLQRQPDDRKARLLLSELYLSQDKIPQANREIAHVLNLWPQDEQALKIRALCSELHDAEENRHLHSDDKEPVPLEGFSSRNELLLAASRSVSHTTEVVLQSEVSPLKKALQALQNNQPREAVQILRPLVSSEPDKATLQRTLGVALYRSGDVLEAQKALQRAVSLDNHDALAYFLLGCVLENQGKSDSAEEHFRKATRLNERIGTSVLRR